MIAKLFDIENGTVIPTEHCYTLKSLKHIKMYNLPYLKQEVQSLIMWLKDNPIC